MQPCARALPRCLMCSETPRSATHAALSCKLARAAADNVSATAGMSAIRRRSGKSTAAEADPPSAWESRMLCASRVDPGPIGRTV